MISADDIDDGFVPRRTSALASAEVEGETVLYQKAQQTIHVLNPSASTVWTLIDGATDVLELAMQLAVAFDVAPAVMLGQVRDIIQQFGRQGLLYRVSADQEVVAQIRLDLLRRTEVGSEVGHD